MLSAKFVRAHAVPGSTFGFAWMFKLIYEFWGFCVNGGQSLTVPGGFAATNGVSFPQGFQSSSGLVASGSDGYTVGGQPTFSALHAAFPPSCIGKHLVAWKPGSTSTDDSVYEITRWIDSSSVRVNVLQGGTPSTDTLRPTFTARDRINYRVVDLRTVSALTGYTTNDSMVLQFNGAPIVNPSQSLSQARLRKQTTPNYSVGITLSPSGSWNGSSFQDASTELLVTSSAVAGWYGSASDSPAFITLIAAQDFIIVHCKAQQPQASGFHVEVPQRLYPSSVDPNPICMMNYGSYSATQLDSGSHYGGGFYMHNPPDGSTMQYFGAARQLFGDSAPPIGALQNGRTNGAVFNVYTGRHTIVDAVLAHTGTVGQFQMARVRLRRTRFAASFLQQYLRLGQAGEWIHVGNGVLWPWDNAALPYPMFMGGS